MEERLYFEPETSGKKKIKKEKEKKKNHKFLKLFFFLLFLLIIILIIIWLLNGSKTISGQYPENVKNESLTCISNNIQYEKTSWIDSDNKELKINAIFNGEDSLKTISLIYTLTYASEEDAYFAEAKSHAQINEGFATIGYNTRKFNNKFSRYDNKLIITLTASGAEIDEYSADYFLLPKEETKARLEKLSDYEKELEAKGLKCASTIEE